MPKSTPPVSPIVFYEPDSEAASIALADALHNTPPEVAVLGLIVKVEQDRIVNWEFATPETVKSLALALIASNDETSTPSPKES